MQNPQDPRARSDVRLMNLVVSFLSMLGTEEENGGVKRTLGVCSEFERIAKVVLDKAEKETSSRRKRKSHDGSARSSHPRASQPQTPMNPAQNHMPGAFSPNSTNHLNSRNGFSPMQGASPNSNWPSDFGASGNDFMGQNMATPFGSVQGFTNGNEFNSPLDPNAFQQPFVPQDLWQMPMTLEWDWAEMTGGAYQSFENGIMGDPNLHMNNNAHLQHQGGGM